MKSSIVAVAALSVMLAGCIDAIIETPEQKLVKEFSASKDGKEIESCFRSQGQSTEWKVTDVQAEVGTGMYLIRARSAGTETAKNKQDVIIALLHDSADGTQEMHYAGLLSNYGKSVSRIERTISNGMNVIVWCTGSRLE